MPRAPLPLTGLLVILAAPAGADVIYDAHGFNNFTVGPLDGQDGWDAGYIALDPYVGTAPRIADWGGGDLGIIIEVDEFGSYMSRDVIDVIGAGYSQVTVTFDVWRFSSDPPTTLGWYWDADVDEFDGWAGRQDEMTQPAAPGIATDTIYDRFVNVHLTWDFNAMTVLALYDGLHVDTVNLAEVPDELTAFGFDMWAPPGGGHACIDNLIISAAPAPAGCALLFSAAAAALRRRRR